MIKSKVTRYRFCFNFARCAMRKALPDCLRGWFKNVQSRSCAQEFIIIIIHVFVHLDHAKYASRPLDSFTFLAPTPGPFTLHGLFFSTLFLRFTLWPTSQQKLHSQRVLYLSPLIPAASRPYFNVEIYFTSSVLALL